MAFDVLRMLRYCRYAQQSVADVDGAALAAHWQFLDRHSRRGRFNAGITASTRVPRQGAEGRTTVVDSPAVQPANPLTPPRVRPTKRRQGQTTLPPPAPSPRLPNVGLLPPRPTTARRPVGRAGVAPPQRGSGARSSSSAASGASKKKRSNPRGEAAERGGVTPARPSLTQKSGTGIEDPGSKPPMGELRSIVPYFRPYVRGFSLGLVCVVFANAFQIAGPYLMRLAIDGLDQDATSGRIAFLAGLIVAAAAAGGVFRYGMRKLLNGISRRIETDLRNNFFEHLLRLDAAFYGATRTGDLMSRATNDTLAVRMAVGPAIMYTMNTVVGFVFALALMIWISPRLTLFVIAPTLVLPPIVLGFGRIIHRRFEEIQEQFSTLSTFVQENLTGVRIVRAYAQEPEQARQFDAYNEEYRSKNMRLVVTAGAFQPVLMLISGIGMALVTWLGALEVIAGRMTIGDFVAFGLLVGLLIWPMIALGWVVNLYQRGAASMGRINKILNAEPAVAIPAEPASLEHARGRVEFRDVSFAYPGTERHVLHGVSFVAEPGDTVALVGPTGSGKSTLIELVARLYDPTDGEILLDDIPLTDLDPADVRRRIGMVPQEAFLFSNTMENNIGLGLERGSMESEAFSHTIRTAAGVAQLHDQILDFPQQYETMLGERGINLSGGQKQRATLARALARDPLVLVLDDALSAVDTHTESAILTDLRDVTGSRTAFIISHRVSAVMHADKILVLEDGRIVQEGTHAELISTDGTYARLRRRQLIEEDLVSEPAAVGD